MQYREPPFGHFTITETWHVYKLYNNHRPTQLENQESYNPKTQNIARIVQLINTNTEQESYNPKQNI